MATHALAKPPAPTGDPWVPSPKDPATIPVPLPVIIVSVEGPYTEQDRKLWTFLLHAMWDELGEKPIHAIPTREINQMFRDMHGRHHTDWIWESARRLSKTTVEWRATEGDKRYKGISALFGAKTEEEDQETGVLQFHFPPLLIPILKDPRRYARLRTHFLVRLSGKYAVTMYELLESVANKEAPVLEAGIEDLRRWLKVPEGKMTRGPDFRRFVLEPAIEQINKDPEGAGFSVRMTAQKQGKAVKWFRFEVIKTKERRAIEAKLREQEKQRDLFEVYLKTDTYEQARHFAPGWDIYVLESEWRAWAQDKGDWPPQKPDAAFLGFCKHRGAHPGAHR